MIFNVVSGSVRRRFYAPTRPGKRRRCAGGQPPDPAEPWPQAGERAGSGLLAPAPGLQAELLELAVQVVRLQAGLLRQAGRVAARRR